MPQKKGVDGPFVISWYQDARPRFRSVSGVRSAACHFGRDGLDDPGV